MLISSIIVRWRFLLIVFIIFSMFSNFYCIQYLRSRHFPKHIENGGGNWKTVKDRSFLGWKFFQQPIHLYPNQPHFPVIFSGRSRIWHHLTLWFPFHATLGINRAIKRPLPPPQYQYETRMPTHTLHLRRNTHTYTFSPPFPVCTSP